MRPLIWPEYMKHEFLTDVLFPAFTSRCPLSQCWSHLYADYTVGPLRHWNGVLWWQRGERHAWGRVEEVVGVVREDEVWMQSILYRLPAWLTIHLELQVISSLNAPPVLSANSKMVTKRGRGGQTVQRLDRKKKKIRLKMTKSTNIQRLLTHRPPTSGNFQQ